MKKRKINRIVVAMSGGVDSSVTAALLRKEGFDIAGVFMKFWSETGANRCCSSESEVRARRVAKILNIPFYVFNVEKEFKKRIVDYFLKSEKAGLTPNPCVVCNKEIKFGLLLEKVLKMGASYVAAGHYARLVEDEHQPIKLYKGRDKEKDQSYFLWKLSQKQLRRVLFPVGNYKRAEVEKLAKKFKLPFEGVRKSQEICFIPGTIEDFLKRRLKSKSGQIITEEGKRVGKHEGLWLYTIGQRKGIGLSGGPYFVLNKDLRGNNLVVTKNERDLYEKELVVKNINWISGKEPKLPLKISAKIRYRSKPVSAVINKILHSTFYVLKLARPQRAITPGQSAVFYKNRELVGGGVIC